MSRKLRIHRPAAFYHVMLRGNNGQDIFFSDRDRCRFLLLLQEGVERYNYRVHAYCLMRNHVHLVIQTGTVPLSRLVQHLTTCYAIYINKTQGRIGHLFQGRFKAILVDAKNYLTELVRYVHLNPVRASLVSRPEDYFWSSHLAYLGLRTIAWLTQEWLLKKFDSHEISARQFYTDFINKGIGKPIAQELYRGTHEGYILGDDTFIEEVLKEKQRAKMSNGVLKISDLLNIIAEVYQVSVVELKSHAKGSNLAQARGLAAFFAREYDQFSLKALADELNKDSTALSKSATALEKLSQSDKNLKNSIDCVREKVMLLEKID